MPPDADPLRDLSTIRVSSSPTPPRPRQQAPRNFLDRGEQRRLFWVVMPPALVLVLLGVWIEQALFTRPPDAPWEQVDTRLPGGPRGEAGEGLDDAIVIERAPEPLAEHADDLGAPAEVLAKVRDDTVFRESDSDAWFALWKTIQEDDQAALARQVGPPVGFSELFGQPRSFRGRPIRIRGTLRRLQQVPAPTNTLGIETYWQGWLDPEGGPPSPIVTYFLTLPKTIRPGMRIIEPVEVVGYFFKRWAYQATDTIRTAPLVMAAEPRALAVPSTKRETRITTVLLWTGGILAMIGLWLFAKTRLRRHGRPRTVAASLVVLAAATTLVRPGVAADDGKPATNIAAPLTTAAYLDRFDLAAADREAIGAISAWSEERLDIGLRILARLTSAPPELRVAWGADAIPPETVVATPAGESDQPIHVVGQAVLVRELPLGPDVSERHARQTVHLVRIVDSDGLAVDVLAEHVPKAWARDTAIDEPADAVGVLLARDSGPPLEADDQAPSLTLVAARVAWRPGTPLGSLGMDYGLFDAVQDGRKLLASDADAFYDMLAATGRATPEGLETAAGDVSDVLALIDPQVQWLETHRGAPVRIRGTARRAIRIAIDDPFRRSQLGSNHYWEVYVFVSTPTPVQIHGRVQDTYPMVACLRELPPGMPTGERISEEVDVAGFAFKRYRYPTAAGRGVAGGGAAGAGADIAQESPLIVGRTLRWFPDTAPPAARQLDRILGPVLIVVVLLLVVAGWATAPRSRKHRSGH